MRFVNTSAVLLKHNDFTKTILKPFGNFVSLVLGSEFFAINSSLEIIDERIDADSHVGSMPVYVASIQVGFIDAKNCGLHISSALVHSPRSEPDWVKYLQEEAANHFGEV